MEGHKQLSARVAAVLGGLVLSAILWIFSVVWIDGRHNERRDADIEHTELRMGELESDCKEFRRASTTEHVSKMRELRTEFIGCRNRLESEIAAIRVGPSKYEAQGKQIRALINDFREVQKDVLTRLRILESNISMLQVKGTDVKN